jgi:solute carrier family 13 (sodium-dependent dicarboxylate transporter), member 2/3/5
MPISFSATLPSQRPVDPSCVGRGPLPALLKALLAAATLTLLWLGTADWTLPARLALAVFALAVVGWTVMRLDETPVALAAALALVGLGVSTPHMLYSALGDSFIWLLIGACVLAAVLHISGLAERMAHWAVAGSGSVQALMLRLTLMIVASAFVIPSTSGRAALLLPVFVMLAQQLRQPRIVLALALLFPSVILLSACASLLGAGAHLVAAEFIVKLGHPAPSFATWAWWCAPFALLSSLAASGLIAGLFLSRAERCQALPNAAAALPPLTPAQRRVCAVTLFTVAAWATSGWHGVDATLMALLGALLATCKPLSGVDMKTALKKVEWNLVLFLAATMVLGEALLHSGAAQALAQTLLQAVPLQRWSPAAVMLLAVGVALLSHLLVTSRTSRALVLLPSVALPLAATGINPALLILVMVVGSGFCQTLAVSAKPVALFARVELPQGLAPLAPDIDLALMRLSLWLLPVMVLLLTLWALWLWPLQGLPLRG